VKLTAIFKTIPLFK